MDNAKLIEMVCDRKQLWDVRDRNYHNRDFSRKLWNEIAIEMQCNSHVAKSKWQNLRDTYRKEYTKLVRIGDDSKGSNWKYFQKLKFLDDVIAMRKRPVPSHGARDEYEEFTDITPLRYLCQVPQTVQGEAESASDSSHSPADSENNASPAKTPDEDYHFVMSILPHLRDLPKRRKLHVRQKLQRILMDEQRRPTLTCTRCREKKESRTKINVNAVREIKTEISDNESA